MQRRALTCQGPLFQTHGYAHDMYGSYQSSRHTFFLFYVIDLMEDLSWFSQIRMQRRHLKGAQTYNFKQMKYLTHPYKEIDTGRNTRLSELFFPDS